MNIWYNLKRVWIHFAYHIQLFQIDDVSLSQSRIWWVNRSRWGKIVLNRIVMKQKIRISMLMIQLEWIQVFSNQRCSNQRSEFKWIGIFRIQKVLIPDILNSELLNPMVRNLKYVPADEDGVEVRPEVEVATRFTVILYETLVTD